MISQNPRSSSASAHSASDSIRTASGSRSSIPASRSPAFYNVLEKLRSGELLTDKEKPIHDQGLVTVLRQIHDELDEAVLEAYGWGDLSVEIQDGKTQESRQEQIRGELLTRLVALNHERATDEKRGLIRWLRPDYQNPTAAAPQPVQANLTITDPDSSNQKSTILNRQSIPPPLSPGPTASPSKSPSSASSSATTTRMS